MLTQSELHVPMLVSRCLAGDQLAIRKLVDRYQAKVFSLCFRILGHRQDAEDMAQETFVRLIKSLHRWDSGRAFEPWLMTIAVNRCRTLLATRKKRQSSEPLWHESLVPDNRNSGNADSLEEELNLALDDIPEKYRRAFLLFHREEMSYEQISEAMACPIGTVKTWVHRARKRLIRRLAKRGVIEEARLAMS